MSRRAAVWTVRLAAAPLLVADTWTFATTPSPLHAILSALGALTLAAGVSLYR